MTAVQQMTRGQLVEHMQREHAGGLRAELGPHPWLRMQAVLLRLSLAELHELHDELHELDITSRHRWAGHQKRSNTSTGQRAGASDPRPPSPPGSSGSGELAGLIDTIDRALRDGPELIGDVARPIVDVIADIVEAAYDAWNKLTGLPRFALVAYVYLEMTKREQERVNRRRR